LGFLFWVILTIPLYETPGSFVHEFRAVNNHYVAF